MSIHTPEDYAECDRAFAKLKAELVDVRASWKAADRELTYQRELTQAAVKDSEEARAELAEVKSKWEACAEAAGDPLEDQTTRLSAANAELWAENARLRGALAEIELMHSAFWQAKDIAHEALKKGGA